MTKLVWDTVGERYYESGVSNGVLYPMESGAYSDGVAWNGLTAVNESPEGGEPNPLYADNIKYLNLMSAEEFKATVEAYTYPDEFMECDGSAELSEGIYVGQQSRKQFGLCYQTRIGNDTEGTDHGYKIHLIYGCYAAPSSRDYETINDNPDAITFSWDVSTTPVEVTGMKPTSHIIIDSTKVPEAKLTTLKNKLYGTENTEPELPLPSAIATIVGVTGATGATS